MKNKATLVLGTVAMLAASGVVAETITFQSNFDEADLGSIAGLNIDTPSTTGADSGTVSLDTVNDQLALTANAANTWTAREGAPIAWVAAPSVSVGETWFVETQVNMVNDTGTTETWDQGGITFYGGTDGASPTGSYALLLSDWNGWAASQAIFGTGGGGNSEAADLTATDNNQFLRIEITAGVTEDTYNFFYKEDAGDAWTQLLADAENKVASFDNSRVGLIVKSHNDNATGAAQFDSLTVGVIPEPGTLGLVAVFGGGIMFIRRRMKR